MYFSLLNKRHLEIWELQKLPNHFDIKFIPFLPVSLSSIKAKTDKYRSFILHPYHLAPKNEHDMAVGERKNQHQPTQSQSCPMRHRLRPRQPQVWLTPRPRNQQLLRLIWPLHQSCCSNVTDWWRQLEVHVYNIYLWLKKI